MKNHNKIEVVPLAKYIFGRRGTKKIGTLAVNFGPISYFKAAGRKQKTFSANIVKYPTNLCVLNLEESLAFKHLKSLDTCRGNLETLYQRDVQLFI